MPLPESADPRVRTWSKQWTLKELGMEPGDELYFFVRAADNAEPPHATVSPTYTLRLPGPVAADDESTALPMLVKPENLRSQRQIIIDTEQLIADVKANPSLPGATVRARSEAIASDQAMLRRRYGQFLGEESSLFGGEEHEQHSGKEDVVAEYGHAHDQAENATLFDEATKKVLRRAQLSDVGRREAPARHHAQERAAARVQSARGDQGTAAGRPHLSAQDGIRAACNQGRNPHDR
ncbi:hypothetical protein LP419_16855 [Massilia sp. H-1]|nr:hypothetical protein LP419_16855 [Massilia sp. H-1]